MVFAVGDGTGYLESKSYECLKSEVAAMSFSIDPTLSPAEGDDDLASVALIEFFEADDRPIFVIDLEAQIGTILVFQNESLQRIQHHGFNLYTEPPSFMDNTDGISNKGSILNWAVSSPETRSIGPFVQWGIHWRGMNIRNRWRVITGELENQHNGYTKQNSSMRLSWPRPRPKQLLDRKTTERQPRPSSFSQANLEEQLAAFRLHDDENITFLSRSRDTLDNSAPKQRKDFENLGFCDITDRNCSMPRSNHVDFFLNFDWTETELGPIHSWSTELRRMVNLLMNDPRPAAMYWGTQRIMMYNEPYQKITGQKYPGRMGKPFAEAWPELERDLAPGFQSVCETRTSYNVMDARFDIDRRGYLEECYFCFSIIPLISSDGEIAFYNPTADYTKCVVQDRRMTFMIRLGQHIASSRESKHFWQQLLLSLEVEDPDIPFALLYSADRDASETLSESSVYSQSLRNWAFEGSVRLEESCDLLFRRYSSEEPIENFLPNFDEMIKREEPTLLLAADDTFPQTLRHSMKNTEKGICDAAVFLPLRAAGDAVLGFIILGVNPRKQFDGDYKVFIELLGRQLTDTMAAAVLFEDEIRKGRIEAELVTEDRNRLSRKLAIQTHQANEVESRFRRMADLAPVGMFHIDINGALLYANDEYYKLTGHPRDIFHPFSWYEVLLEDDHQLMDQHWGKLVAGETTSLELRLKQPFVAEEVVGGEKVEGFTWIIMGAYAERAEDGTVVAILGCMTDISRNKWAEGFQKRKTQEAIELKRQQENFIDMTSHEMRNPLSAIVQCAEWIGSSLSEFGGGIKDVLVPHEILDNCADAGQTIALCAQHQKRIIDDILTLSKLDSDLLSISPMEVRPVAVIQSALKMFDAELHKFDIGLRFHVEPAFYELAVDWVMLDPSRMLQIFINLITNAIKFTQTEIKRKIVISLQASLMRPKSHDDLHYLPKNPQYKDQTTGSSYGTGEVIYLSIEVNDSGRGLDENERNLLFRRFSQASPRTHVQYGGSGLGLFISRQLTEIQGGQIGVAPQAGAGSTFAFYVRTRRCPPPKDPIISIVPFEIRAQTRAATPAALDNIQQKSSVTVAPPKAINKKVLGKSRHVLVVEDNIVNQKVLSKQLRSVGYSVNVANHGGEALSFLQKTQFWSSGHRDENSLWLDVVLMDLEMPIMDGLTCVKRIRQLQKEMKVKGHVPIIAVTANARSEQIAVAKEAGMDSVVTKPFRIPELMPEMDRIVEITSGLNG